MLDISPHVEQMIIAKAEQQGMSVQDFIISLVMQETTPTNPMIARAMANKNPSILGDGLTIQRELRNEWN